MSKEKMSISDFDARMAPLNGSDMVLSWHSPAKPPFRLAGFPWFDHDKVFRRLPSVPPGKLPSAVDCLANRTAGGQVAFQSDSRHVAVRVKLAGPADMNHMPATGQCGFDLYTGLPSAMRFHSVTKYDHRQTEHEVPLFEHPEAALRTFTLNFPLYMGVDALRIGLDPDARIQTAPPYSIMGRIVAYGTSITQGGCASRPGMAYTNILSRMFNAEVVNLGFSGNGKGEPEVCRTFSQIADPRLFVLDYEANADFDRLKATLPENIRILRERHRDVPILVVSRILFSRDVTHAESRRECERARDMQAQLVENAGKNGDPHVYFLDGSTLLGDDFDECTVDGAHPTDMGFMRMARGMEPVIRRILGVSQPGAPADG